MIQAVELVKKFEDKAALDGVDFQIEKGSIYGLVGANGSGKSTLLRVIAGVYMPDGGNIIVDNMKVFNNPELKEKICYLPDTPFFIHQSNLNEMARFYEGLYCSFSRERFEYLTGVFPLDKKAKIANMSKGMQRQAALILALSCCPKYLLLDEAFDGLDPVMRKVLKSLLIEGIEGGGMTAIIASHNLRELEELCDHVGLIHNGKIIFNDTIEGLKGNLHKVQIAFERIPDTSVFDSLDVLSIERMGSLLNLAVRGDAQKIESFLKKLNPVFMEILPPTLEEIFIYELEVTGYDVQEIIN